MQLDSIQTTLSQRGYRQSKVRRQLLQVLAEDQKLGADDMLERFAGGRQPNRTTIYRELEMLVREGFVSELDFGEGKKRYELNTGHHHHHLYCRGCSVIQCVEIGQHLRAVEQRIHSDSGFVVQSHHLEFFGLCADCQQAV